MVYGIDSGLAENEGYKMSFYLNIGEAISVDEAIDTGMTDVDEKVIFQSEESPDGERHVIVLTVWQKGNDLAHNFAYAVDADDVLETLESGDCPIGPVDHLPEEHQSLAAESIDRWRTIFLTEVHGVQP